MSADRLLLDTTVQLWRIAYGAEEASVFHGELAGQKEVYTTSFVFREFLNTIIADIKYVYLQTQELLYPQDDGRVGLDQLVRFLAIGKGNFSNRSVRRIHLVIGMLLESFEYTRVPKGKILVRLERTASRFVRDFFRYPNQVGQYRSVICLAGLDDDPSELNNMRTCRPFPERPAFPRKVAAFLEKAKSQVEQVENEMSKATLAQGRDDKLLKVFRYLKDGRGRFDFSEKLRRYKTWNWALGDLLIALETPGDAAISRRTERLGFTAGPSASPAIRVTECLVD